MPFKRSLYICAAALMLLSAGSTGAMASTGRKAGRSGHTARIVHHLSNVRRAAQVRATHTRNVYRINRIKRHLINHQKNLIKISKRINRAKRHHRNANLINRLNNDKARLIKAVEHNERGMVRLAQTVANEEHQINLLRHPRRQDTSVNEANQAQRPAVNHSVTKVQLPQPNTDSVNNSEGHSVMTFINEVNGKLTKYIAKDSGYTDRNGQQNSRSYSDVNGQYSASPSQITSDEMNQLNQQIQDQLQDSNHWLSAVNHDMSQEFNALF